MTFQLDPSLEELLRREVGDLSRAAKEALLLQAFRDGKLSHHALGQALGLDRFETNAFLKAHRVFEGSLTSEDLEEDTAALDRVLGPVR